MPDHKEGPRTGRSLRTKLAKTAVLGAAALAGPALAASTAHAAVTDPHVLTAGLNNGPNLNGEFYPANSTLAVAVTRPDVVTGAPVTVATATAKTDPDGTLLLNSPTLVEAPAVSSCWTGFTPELNGGDTVSITGPGTDDSMVLDGVSADAPIVSGSNIEIHGTAASGASGLQIPVSQLSVQFTSTPKAKFSNNKQFLAGVVTYDAFDSTHWTARFTGVNAGDQTIAHASTPEVLVEDPIGTATTVFDVGARLTSLPNCTQPVRRNAVTATTATGSARADVVSSATVAGGTLNAKGLAQPGVTAVSVTVDDANPDTAPVIAPASVSPSGAWAASVAGGQLAGLDDGALTVAANYTLASGTVAGVNGGIAKDTVAPAAPASTLAPGSYVGAQSTTLSSDADATIRYTTDGSTPTATSAKAAGALSVAASQTVKAVAFDAAGNASAVSTFAFTITAPPVVTPPAAGTPSTPIGTGTGTGAGAPTPQAPVIVVPSTGSTTPARRTLRFASLSVAKTIKLAAARKGVKVTMVLPAGASRVDYTLRRGSKLVRSGRALHGAGRAVLRLKVAQRGSYRLTLKLRGSAAGQQKVVTFRVV